LYCSLRRFWSISPEALLLVVSGFEMNGERIVEIEFKSDLMREAFGLRYEVFVDEQGVPRELEVDELDEAAIHLVTIRDGAIVGTLRILEYDDAAKIGRVAVRAALRSTGIGARLMERAAAIALGRGFAEIVLHAQVTVAGFYRRLGYVEEGDPFDEAGIPHIAMRKKIA
jgi:predicted GNAT family N-acyltransferase